MIGILFDLAALLLALTFGFVLGVACLAHDMDRKAPDLFAEYARRIRATRRCKNGRV